MKQLKKQTGLCKKDNQKEIHDKNLKSEQEVATKQRAISSFDFCRS